MRGRCPPGQATGQLEALHAWVSEMQLSWVTHRLTHDTCRPHTSPLITPIAESRGPRIRILQTGLSGFPQLRTLVTPRAPSLQHCEREMFAVPKPPSLRSFVLAA